MSVALSSDGQVLASGGSDGNVQLWDLGTKQIRAVLNGNTGGVMSLLYSRDGQTLAVACVDNKVKLWNVVRQSLLAELDHNHAVWSLALSANGKYLATGSGYVTLWDTSNWHRVTTLEGGNSYIASLAFGKNDTILASGACGVTFEDREAPGEIKIWSVADIGKR